VANDYDPTYDNDADNGLGYIDVAAPATIAAPPGDRGDVKLPGTAPGRPAPAAAPPTDTVARDVAIRLAHEGAAGTAALVPDAAALDAEIAAILKDAKHPYHDRTSPKHAEAIAHMAQLYARRYPEAEGAEPIDVDALRRLTGVALEVPEQYADRYDAQQEANFHAFVIDNAIPQATAAALVDFYTDAYVLSGGDFESPATLARVEAEFHRAFAHRLPQEQRDLLVRWMREEVHRG
jgi:hypothetical protein